MAAVICYPLELDAPRVEALEEIGAVSNLPPREQIRRAVDDWIEWHCSDSLEGFDELIAIARRADATADDLRDALTAVFAMGYGSQRVGGEMHYVVVIERGDTNYAASVPDLPGVFSIGDTEAEARTNLIEAIRLYLAELHAAGEPVPEPRCTISTVALPIPE